MHKLKFLVFSVLLLGEALSDLRTREIPDGFHAAAIIWWLLTALLDFLSGASFASIAYTLVDGLLGGFVIAGSLLVLSVIFDKITGLESMGGGDIKMFFVTGLYLGLAVNFLNLILSCVIGLLFAAAFAGRRKAFPFAPSIALSTYLCMLLGDKVVNWYFHLFL